jgi:AraC family transcriptional regulator of adaptative response/methylated-DNA-[protein]-cysteine methyltransferase
MTKTMPVKQEWVRAYRKSDATYEGIFYLAVRTTGIFCRPTCPARKPLPQNVEFFATPREALASGYRPCKRCRPMQQVNQPEWVVKLLALVEENTMEKISAAQVRRVGVDPASARRYFQKHYGMTFQAYARARRLSGSLAQIRNGQTVDRATFASGYESPSGFREAYQKLFGTTPRRAAGQACITLAWMKSPLGPLVAGANDQGICFLEFTDRRMLEGQLKSLQKHFKTPCVPGKHRYLEQLEKELEAYFAGELRTFTVPLCYPGSAFQRRVWEELLQIPYGETRSYEALAQLAGVPGAQRAVGRTNGLNRIAIVIPCHRVINKDGKLGGYGGGLRRKEFLLKLEQRARAV